MRDLHRARDRGQSEALGFLLIFAVVVLTIALVGVAGFSGLESVQDFQRTTNAEQGFVVLADNVDDLTEGGAPGRTTEIRLAGGTLSTTTAETTVEVTDANGTTSATVDTEPIVYDSGTGTTLTYRSGAVVRTDDGSPAMLREPGFVLTDERVILPVVNASLTGGKVGGTTAVNVRTRRVGTRLVAAGDSVDTVTVTVNSSHPAAWERYFETFEGGGGPVTNVDRSGNSVTATVETDRAYVTVYRVEVRFQ